MSFREASAVERQGEGRYRCNTPEGWQQGRGVFGGLVLGTLARVMGEEVRGEGRALRSLGGEVCAPVLPGEGSIELSTLRRGRGITYLDARFLQEGEIVARASAAFAASRRVETPSLRTKRPEAPPWAEVEPLPLDSKLIPAFGRHYEYRSTGPWPFSEHEEALASGWVRERAAERPLEAPDLVGLIDSWWPAICAVESTPRPAATISFMLELLCDPATLSGERPLLYQGRSIAAREGYFVELRELWAEDGPVAFNQQTFALLG